MPTEGSRIIAVVPTTAPNVYVVYCENGDVYLHDPLDGRSDKLAPFPGRICDPEGDTVEHGVRPSKHRTRM